MHQTERPDQKGKPYATIKDKEWLSSEAVHRNAKAVWVRGLMVIKAINCRYV